MKPFVKATIITAIITAFAYATFSLIMLALSVKQAKSLRAVAERVTAFIQAKDIDGAVQAYKTDIRPAFDVIEKRARYSAWIAFVPVARQPYIAYQEVLKAGESIVAIADDILLKASRVENGVTSLDLAKAGTVGLEHYADIIEALTLLQNAGSRISNVSSNLIPDSLAQDWQEALGLAEQLRVQMEVFKPFISDLPVLLGQDEPYDILVLLQNPHELRATGGFIGTYGRLTFDQGKITVFFTDDIYNLDVNLLRKPKQKPPQPMQQYLLVNDWYVRDSNWYPDFPTSSRQIIELYKAASGEADIDMVVALTPAIVEKFLALTGPITVDNITFTSQNLIDELEYRVEQEFWRIGLRNDERKKIINDLAQALKSRFFDMNSQQMHQFSDAVMEVLREKDVLMFSTDERVQRELLAAGWAGELRSSAGDYLFVVDSNFGAYKTDRILDRSISYAASQQADGSWLATLLLQYTNDGVADYRTTNYRTYTRIYVPFGSTLVSSSGFMLRDRAPANAQPAVYTEEGKTVFAGFTTVPLGQSRTVALTYKLPAWLGQEIAERGQYSLVWQKQPGTQTPMTFSLISREQLYSFAPSQLSYTLVDPRQIRVSAALDTDQQFTVKLRP